MKLYPVDEAPLGRTARKYQQSPWSGVVALTVLGAIIGGLAYAIILGNAPRFLWLLVGFLVFLELLFLGMTRSAFRPDNWVVKFDGTQIAFKFRSYLNAHFPREDAVVAVFPTSAFAGVRKTTRLRHVPGSGGSEAGSRETWVALEFELKDAEQAVSLEAAIRRELARESPRRGRRRIKHHHAPVRVVAPRTISVSWRGSQDHVRPGVEAALRQLGGAIPVGDAERVEGRHWEDMTAEEFELYVVELAQTGKQIQAAGLLRSKRGMGLKEAREYLRGRMGEEE